MIYMLCVIFVGMLEFVVVVFVVIYEVGFLVLFVFIQFDCLVGCGMKFQVSVVKCYVVEYGMIVV